MIKLYVKRIGMVILFVWALLTTFGAISGVSAAGWNIEKQHKFIDYEHKKNWFEVARTHITRKFSVKMKELKVVKPKRTMISSSETSSKVTNLEDAIDWSVYKKHTVIATGYTAGFESTGKEPEHPSYGITYSGVKVKRDLYSTIAADLRVFPIGTILFIPEYGYGVVADKGGAIKGNKLDLYYETVADVYKHWGKRKVEVYIVKKGNGKLTERDLKLLNENKALQVFRQAYLPSKS